MKGEIVDAQIAANEWMVSNSGNEYLALRVVVAGEEYVASIYFTEKSIGMARSKLRACGFDPDTQELAEIGKSISLVGRNVQVDIYNDTYGGKTRVKADICTDAPPNRERIVALQAQLRAAKKSSTETDEEIPF